MEVLKILAEGFMQYGAIGLLALAGWVVSGWYFYRDFKKKEERDAIIKAKEEELSRVRDELGKEKDAHRKSIEDFAEKRLADNKEMIEDYNELATNTTHAIDKIAIALEVKKVR